MHKMSMNKMSSRAKFIVGLILCLIGTVAIVMNIVPDLIPVYDWFPTITVWHYFFYGVAIFLVGGVFLDSAVETRKKEKQAVNE